MWAYVSGNGGVPRCRAALRKLHSGWPRDRRVPPCTPSVLERSRRPVSGWAAGLANNRSRFSSTDAEQGNKPKPFEDIVNEDWRRFFDSRR
jgi:hypothetical protein